MTLNELDLYETTVLYHKPLWKTPLFCGVVGAIILLVIIVILYCIVKKWRKNLNKKVLSPTKQALHDILLLQQKNLVNGARGKEFYAQLTALLKQFFYKKGYISSESMTDDELIAYFVKQQMFHDSIDSL